VGLDATDLTPAELLGIRRFTWKRGTEERAVVLVAARPQVKRILATFEGVRGREQAAELTNGMIWAEDTALPDPGPGVAYAFQLIGLRVETTEGRVLGTLDDIMTAAANPIYVVHGEREWLIPGIPEVVRRVDLPGGVITVDLPAGLDEL
jgi:16S rRNA processing protein RimM